MISIAPIKSPAARSMAALQPSLSWQCENARHHERLPAPQLNLCRDILPPPLESEVLHRPVGHRAEQRFAAGDLLPGVEDRNGLALDPNAFNHRLRGVYIEPRAGRSCPKGFIAGTRDILPGVRQSGARPR